MLLCPLSGLWDPDFVDLHDYIAPVNEVYVMYHDRKTHSEAYFPEVRKEAT